MKKLILVLFIALSFSSFGQTITLDFNTISVINKETSVVKSTVHQMSKFLITEKTVNVTTELSFTTYNIVGTPQVRRIDGQEILTIECKDSYVLGIIVVRDKPHNGVYLVYKDRMVYYYNS